MVICRELVKTIWENFISYNLNELTKTAHGTPTNIFLSTDAIRAINIKNKFMSIFNIQDGVRHSRMFSIIIFHAVKHSNKLVLSFHIDIMPGV